MARAAQKIGSPAGADVIRLAAANFTSRFLDGLPAVAAALVAPTPVRSPRVRAWATEFARRFDLAPPDDADLAVLAGNAVPSGARAYAARYGGHQFGHWAGQLGDGRAIGLGELRDRDGVDWEIQLKGAGPTPFSRGADGRAVLRSSVREYVCGEAVHHLGIPTTRALALVTTGDQVVRDQFYDGHPAPEPGAIVCRMAPSFLRIGNFEILAADGDLAGLRQTLDFTITTFYPELGPPGPAAYVELFAAVARRTAELVARWMGVGFVHGVMNTDNTSVLGLTIDYGPYGWLEDFEPGWTPNTTDHPGGRYGYARQPAVGEWNLVQFASAIATLDEGLIPALQDRLSTFADAYRAAHAGLFARKLGVPTIEGDAGARLFAEWEALLAESGADFTNAYRALSQNPGPGEVATWCERPPAGDLAARWSRWFVEHRALVGEAIASPARAAAMDSVNPRYVPRNYLVHDVIARATEGDFSEFDLLTEVLTNPYVDQPGRERFAARRPPWARNQPGCSTLSCSS